jgi:bifunctional non-homologous end joining protein LigD
MPVAWEQLPELNSGAHWTVQTAGDHLLSEETDPWAGYVASRQSLSAAAKVLGLKFAPALRSRA